MTEEDLEDNLHPVMKFKFGVGLSGLPKKKNSWGKDTLDLN